MQRAIDGGWARPQSCKDSCKRRDISRPRCTCLQRLTHSHTARRVHARPGQLSLFRERREHPLAGTSTAQSHLNRQCVCSELSCFNSGTAREANLGSGSKGQEGPIRAQSHPSPRGTTPCHAMPSSPCRDPSHDGNQCQPHHSGEAGRGCRMADIAEASL